MAERGRARRLVWACFLALLIFYLWLAAQIPYTHDDWDWGLPVGLEQLRTASLNSRYAGNLTEVLLTRSPVLKTLVMGAVFALIPAALLRFVGAAEDGPVRALPLLPAANALMLLMPAAVWRQTYGWVAGFSNFVLSGLLLVLYHCMLLRRREKRASAPAALGAFAFGVVMQLFLENTAIYAAAVSLCFAAGRWIREKRPEPLLLALLLGNALGLVLLFANSVYAQLFTVGYALDGTREFVYDLHDSLPAKALRSLKYYVKYFPSLWNHDPALCCPILLLLALSAGRRRPAIWAANALFALYFLGTCLFGELRFASEKLTVYFALSVGLLYFCAVALECLLLFRGEGRRLWILLFVWVSAPLVVAPLAVTDMEGGRLFFTPHLFQAEFCLLLLQRCAGQSAKRARGAAAVCVVLLGAACLRWGVVYHAVGETARQREALLAAAQPGETVTLPAWPYEEILWCPDPDQPKRVEFFRAFYGVDEDVELRFESGAPGA